MKCSRCNKEATFQCHFDSKEFFCHEHAKEHIDFYNFKYVQCTFPIKKEKDDPPSPLVS